MVFGMYRAILESFNTPRSSLIDAKGLRNMVNEFSVHIQRPRLLKWSDDRTRNGVLQGLGLRGAPAPKAKVPSQAESAESKLASLSPVGLGPWRQGCRSLYRICCWPGLLYYSSSRKSRSPGRASLGGRLRAYKIPRRLV